jgi:hypothetical protein
VHDFTELADIEARLPREYMDIVAMRLDLVLILGDELFQPLVESFETRLSQSGSSSAPR